MGPSPASQTEPDCLTANLDALSQRQAELARALEQVQLPDQVEWVIGRDGHPTYRWPQPDGTWAWLGGSSMPGISAPALISGYRPDGRNVVLPMIGSGLEVRLVLDASPPYCAVFVCEPDAVAIRLALQLYDFGAELTAGRLVLVWAQDPVAALLDFFAAHPGYEFPIRLITPGSLLLQQIESLKQALEAAGPRVLEAQWRIATELNKQLEQQHRPPDNLTRVMLISRDPRPSCLELADALQHAAAQRKQSLSCHLPQRPDQCHEVSRLQAIARKKPDLVVLLNCLASPLANYLPPSYPLCSYLVSRDSGQAVVGQRSDRDRLIFFAQASIGERLTQVGRAKAQQLHLLETAVDPDVFAPLPTDQQPTTQERVDVAILADAADLRPEAVNLTLTSHLRLWHELIAVAARSVDDWQDKLAFRVLTQAQRRSGVELKEQKLNERFGTWLSEWIIPTLLVRSAVERLSTAGLTVGLWGQHWSNHQSVKECHRGPIPPASQRNRFYQAAGVVLCPCFDEHTAAIALEVLAAGGKVIYRQPDQPLAQLHPQLNELLKRIPHAGLLDDLEKRVHEHVRSQPIDPNWAQLRQEALEQHTWSHRLETMLAICQKTFTSS